MVLRRAWPLASVLLLLPGPAGAEGPARGATFVYVGTHAAGGSQGIHLFRLQPEGSEVFQNVTLVPLGLAAETVNPSYLEVDPKRGLLFAVNEVDTFEGRPTGAVSAFSIDPASGKLTLLNQRPSMGKGPAHLVLDRTGRHLLVANAGSSVAVLPVAADGRLGEATATVPQAQPRGVALDPANRFAFVCDLGEDKVLAYRFDEEKGTLSPHPPAFVAMKKGTGPRRLVFHPGGRFAYVAGELSSTVTAFAYDAENGALRELQTVSSLPEYFDGPNTTAELVLHPSGKYLYVSNRGHNSIVLFRVDPEAGTLTYVEEQGTGGKTPRHFGLEPSGKHLAVVNEESDTVLASRVDAGNGRLKPSGIFARVASPACVKFVAPLEPAP